MVCLGEKLTKQEFVMKNKIKLIGVIALVVIAGFSMASCGKLDSGVEGKWQREGSTIEISKNSFKVNSVQVGDSVRTPGSDIIVELNNVEVGKATWKIDGKEMTFSNCTLIFIPLTGTWTKQ